MPTRPHPGRFVDAARVVVTVARGRIGEGVHSVFGSGADLMRHGPRLVAVGGHHLALGSGRALRGAGHQLTDLAGRWERAQEH